MSDKKSKGKWVIDEDGDFRQAKHEVVSSLPAGTYKYHRSDSMFGSTEYLTKQKVSADDFILLENDNGSLVASEIQKFWGNADKFRESGFLWKRGMLLWGPPGSGKTAITQYIASWATGHGAIVLVSDSTKELKSGLKFIRKAEKKRPIIVIIEEIDTYDEGGLLPILDGAHQHGNIVFLATTNYPEKLSTRITNRPSRFDRVLFIDFPCDETRDEFLKRKSDILRENDVERKKWVSKTKGMSIAHLRELLVSVECLEIPFHEAIESVASLWTANNTSGRWESKMVKRDS